MRIPDDAKECVCFLCVEDRGHVKYGGTGFFVDLRSEQFPDLGWVYLITAKHCVERAKQYGPLKARLNRIDGSGACLVELNGEWIYSPTHEGSDAAVLQVRLDAKFQYSCLALPESCATDTLLARYKVGVGDELFVMGLFTQRHGTRRNIPIARSGIIASMPEEPLRDQYNNEYHAYLAEIRSIGGLSGSPVFVRLPPERIRRKPGAQWAAYVIGIIRGHWDLKSEQGAEDFEDELGSKLNMGIAIVTPISEAIEIIMKDEDLVRRRKMKEKDFAKAHAPTLDSALPDKPFTRTDFETALKKVSRKIQPGK